MSRSRTTLDRLAGRLADRLILGPTRHEIAASGRSAIRVPCGAGHLELWVQGRGAEETESAGPCVLKFPGTESRAEDAESLALHCWRDLGVTLWSVNPPGYGNSSGAASLANIPAMAIAAVEAMRQETGHRPIIAEGGSLGCVAALYLAAQGRVDGLLLRNPPPLREVVRARTGWWSLGLVPVLLERGIPEAIDSIRNAAAAKVPAVFVTAYQDRVVPLACQYRIIDAYGGACRVLEQLAGGHATPLSETETGRLKQLATWVLAEIDRR
jgi:pimeloyl-ACP methyl ester carboxylesterase